MDVERSVAGGVELDAADRAAAAPTGSGDPHPRLGGHRVTDLGAAAGAAAWLGAAGLAATDRAALTAVGLFVALAVLVLVPLGLGLVATPRRGGGAHPLYAVAVWLHLPAAVAATAALALPVGSPAGLALALPWLGVTSTVALHGLWRLGSRGTLRPVPALAVDAAGLYLPVGAVALLLHRAGLDLGFREVVVLLTAVHYHYAGFVLPLVVGLAAWRMVDDEGRFGGSGIGRRAAAAVVVLIATIPLIAVGIAFSPTVELVAVAVFAVAVAAVAALALRDVVRELAFVPGTLLTASMVLLFPTMALALAYGYSAFPATGRVIGIEGMVRWHGTLNAAGFALPTLLALRLADD